MAVVQRRAVVTGDAEEAVAGAVVLGGGSVANLCLANPSPLTLPSVMYGAMSSVLPYSMGLFILVIRPVMDKLKPKRLRWSVRTGGASAIRIDFVAADFFLQLASSVPHPRCMNPLLAVVFVIAVQPVLVDEPLEQLV